MFAKPLAFLGRVAPQAMAGGVFVGLLVPDLAAILRHALPPSVWLLLVISCIRIDVGEVQRELSRPVRPLLVTLWMLIATPLIVALGLSFFDLRPGIEAGMVLAAASASLFSTPVLATMFGLNGALLLLVLVASTLLVPLTLPTVAFWVLDLNLGTDPVTLMTRMAAFVGSAVAAAIIVRHVFGGARIDRAAPAIDGVSVILLLVFAIGVMDGVTDRIVSDPWDTAFVAAMAFLVYGGLIPLGAGFSRLALPGGGLRDALSIGFISGTRNLAIILAVLPDDADPDTPLFFAMGQFPIYIMPMILGVVFRRLLRRSLA